MNVCILGGDGYLGWPTAMHFSARGHEVLAVDNGVKRILERELGVIPLEPVPTLEERAKRWKAVAGRTIDVVEGDIATDPALLAEVFGSFRPDTIVHYAEQPSAPYSMIDRDAAAYTQSNNVVGTLNVMFAMRDRCPGAHLVKIGTMGEYGTPNFDIEEGWLNVTHNGRSDRVLFPKRPSSFYHLSKVHDSANLEFGCRVWDLRVTDLNQGVVYGIETDESRLDPGLLTSFHYDDVFGTLINRFIVQAAIGVPLTVYGLGGQTRGYLNVRDTLQCVELAALTPAKLGEFRVFNQFTERFRVIDLAERVRGVAENRGIAVSLQQLSNPRVEHEEHYYNPRHSALTDLGLKPHLLTDEVLGQMLDVSLACAGGVDGTTILPRVDFRRGLEARTATEEPTSFVSA